MASNIRARMAQLLTSHRRHVRYLGVLSVIAVFVACGVALSLRQQCITMVRELTVLDCPYSGDGAHMHDASCYDSDGNLVCPLEERELHTHDESCYTEERVLVCGQEEREGHAHTEECYDEDGNLICELEETDGHQHTDDCYQVKRTLTCGQDEVTEVHVHGPGCFKTIVLDDGKSNGSTTSVTSAEQTLLKDLTERDENDDEKLLMSIKVKAPAGTLPKDSAVEVRPLKDDQAEQATTEIEALLRRELGDDVVVKRVQTAQVELVDAQGKKVTPNGNVQVGAWTDFVRDAQELVIVHLADEGDPKHPAAELVSDALLVNWDENDQTTGNENTLQFWMNRPSMAIAIVEVESASPSAEGVIVASRDDQLTTEDVLDFDLDSTDSEDSETPASVDYPAQDFEGHAGNLTVMVSAPQGAFPADTTMQVEAVDTKDVQDAVSSAVPGMVDTVAAVDITFHDAEGMEVKPAELIKVTMTNDEPLVDGIPIVLHVDNEGEASVMAKSAIVSSSDEVSFDADALPTYVMAVKKLQQTLTASDGRTYEITVTYTEEAGLPEDAELVVRELTEADNGYKQTFDRAKATAMSGCKGATINNVRFFDIALVKDGVTLEPLAPVEVNIVMTSGIGLSDATSVVHFVNSRKVELLESEVTTAGDDGETGVGVTFTTESFSIFGVVEMTLEKYVLASDGQTYHVTVTYDTNADIPRNARLAVDEIVAGDTEDEDAYGDYLARAESALGWDAGSATYARLFDIKIVDQAGQKVEPAASVSVNIELSGQESDSSMSTAAQVVHFAEDADVPDVVTGVSVDGQAVSFETDGFSVYAIVDAPPPAVVTIETVATLEELSQNTDEAFLLSYDTTPKYFTNQLNGNSAFIETTSSASASEWYFEPVDSANNTYRLYTEIGGVRHYINNPSSNLAGLVTDAAQATVFQVEQAPNGTFNLKIRGANKWLQHSGSGRGIRFYNDKNNATNSNITLAYASSFVLPDDPYGLDGTTYGIAYHDESSLSTSLSTTELTVGGKKRLGAIDMLMREDTVHGSGLLLIAEGTDITEWTFESVEQDRYYISTTVDGAKKYLTINGENVTLADEPDPTRSVIRAVPGTGAYAGKYSFIVGNYALNLPGGDTDGFNATNNSAATRWMNLVQKSPDLTDDDFRQYTAKKVSVSDTVSVKDGEEIIIYTRIWNDTAKRYDFYVVDYNGSLLRCYDVGDAIEWIGNRRNSARWKFSEYTEGGQPNYYYDLQNSTYGSYISPMLQNSDGQPQVVSDTKPGVNLNGRRYGRNYTTIVAWDDINYEYVGLKADAESGTVVPCSLDDADDFYFAIVQKKEDPADLSTVATVDSDSFGISMQMIDFNNPIVGNRDSGQAALLGEIQNHPRQGLLSTDLKEDGYPVTTDVATSGGATDPAGTSLGALFDGSGLQDVNHLFIQSVYNESGYFEYDSTQNFAHLNTEGELAGTFTVYDQLGAISTRNATIRATRTHGQFMPYDTIEGKGYATYGNGIVITNQTDVLANRLPDSDPRKGEKLYNLGFEESGQGRVDYFFGMQMEASFTQTPNGLDAWGHDIIFEFSGDDDFWLYVDGELVLDLGDIHSAQTGSINFRTGDITYNRGSGDVHTTLYDTFRSNYQKRGLSEAEIATKLNEIFINEDGNYIFKHYSTHTMKMFYMERGAGASNLHMRFNLAAVRPGTFQLSKKLSGTENEANDLIEFPYQIWYKSESTGTYVLLSDPSKVKYVGTSTQAKYQPTFTPAGGQSAYEHVFFLKPGESVEAELPVDVIDYYVVECGVNPDVYDVVKANNAELTGTSTPNGNRKDYKVDPATLIDRSKIEYDNHVKEGSMRSLEITKRLWDQGGQSRLVYPADKTPFTFRLYLGTENDDSRALPLANMYSYHVKDNDGNYCRWDAGTQSFVSLGKTSYSDLTDTEKKQATFTTSINGSISKIPADHTVEVRNLIATTQYKVEERDYEIPKGYTLRLGDGYTRVDVVPEVTTETTPYSGTIQRDETPEIEVRNQKGWGLTAMKEWTDSDFMVSYDPIYFAVYVKHGDELVLDTNAVRQLKSGQTEVYYFFESLETGHRFSDYVIREVTVTTRDGSEPVVDAAGKVTVNDNVVVTPINAGETLTIDGQAYGSPSTSSFSYTVSYKPGEQTTHNENVRTDTVINSRPGIDLLKTDWNGSPLSGAVFTLKNAETGDDVSAAETYTSKTETGRITTAYLAPGTYTLNEIAVPKGSVALPGPMTITVNSDHTVSVSGVDESYYTLVNHGAGASMIATITVKNKSTSFQVKKMDSSTSSPLEGAHFALYYAVEDSVTHEKIKDYNPIPGYEDLVTDANGILHDVNAGLQARTYFLTELQAPDGYDLFPEGHRDLMFTIGEDGTVSIDTEEYKDWLKVSPGAEPGEQSYTIEIPNDREKKVSFKKVDINDRDRVLEGAVFDLYRVIGGVRADTPDYSNMISGADGLLVCDGTEVFKLPVGTYHLVETDAPDGYIMKSEPIVITVAAGTDEHSVSYVEGGSQSVSGRDVIYNSSTQTFTLVITNTNGVELPMTGGPGTMAYTLTGAMLMLAAVCVLVLRRRWE